MARSPAAIASRMTRLRTGRPSSANGGTTTTSNPVSAPELGERGRGPAPVVAERGVGGHEEARQADPLGDPADEDVVLGHPERRVEVLDDGHLDPGRREPGEPLLGIEQERRRVAQDDLVRVGVERDHGRPRGVRCGPPRAAGRAGSGGRGGARRTRRRRRRGARGRVSARRPRGRRPSTASRPAGSGVARGDRGRERRVDEDLVGCQAPVADRGHGDGAPVADRRR